MGFKIKIKVPKLKNLVKEVGNAAGWVAGMGNTMYGLVAKNQVDKELMPGAPGLEESVAAATEDAAKVQKEKEDAERRRRGLLGLNYTGSSGVGNPLNLKRAGLGGMGALNG